MSEKLTGGCLCGAVHYVSTASPGMVGDCYCVDCSKTSGTSHCTHAVVPGDSLTVTGEIKFYDRPADSGNMVSRGFCPVCGSAIYSTNVAMPGMVFLRASSLDDPGQITPQMTVYASRAPHWARPGGSGPVFDTMPPGGPPPELMG
ncbi:MAG: GFA family protein [Sphingomonas sp.]